jgi:hypothetical protein
LEVSPGPFVDILSAILLLPAGACLPEDDIDAPEITPALLYA